MAFLHIASGEGAATCVRHFLAAAAIAEEIVVPAEDALTVGPLDDVDSGATERVAWWATLGSVHGELDDRAMWELVRDDPRPVVIWNSSHPLDRLIALRACFWLRTTPARAYEVRLPPNTKHGLPAFYGAVALATPDVLAAHWPNRTRVMDVDAHARLWERLRRGGSCIRQVGHDDAVIELPLDHYDGALIAACDCGWMRSKQIVGRVLGRSALPLTLLTWRIRELVRRGVFETRGPLDDIGLHVEMRRLR